MNHVGNTVQALLDDTPGICRKCEASGLQCDPGFTITPDASCAADPCDASQDFGQADTACCQACPDLNVASYSSGCTIATCDNGFALDTDGSACVEVTTTEPDAETTEAPEEGSGT